MRVLLDECLPLDFRHELRGHEVHTVQWAGFKGKKNGDLLRAAENAGYEVFLTIDQGIPDQARRGGQRLAVIVLRSRTNQLEHLRLLVESVTHAIATIGPGEIVIVQPPGA
jgi:predicted nuclease of predicted toxin-antitoxin system